MVYEGAIYTYCTTHADMMLNKTEQQTFHFLLFSSVLSLRPSLCSSLIINIGVHLLNSNMVSEPC